MSIAQGCTQVHHSNMRTWASQEAAHMGIALGCTQVHHSKMRTCASQRPAHRCTTAKCAHGHRTGLGAGASQQAVNRGPPMQVYLMHSPKSGPPFVSLAKRPAAMCRSVGIVGCTPGRHVPPCQHCWLHARPACAALSALLAARPAAMCRLLGRLVCSARALQGAGAGTWG